MQSQPAAPPIDACTTSSDCIAVDAGPACCSTGLKRAINKHQIAAWEQEHACHKPVMCPMIRVNDTRVPECDVNAHRCVMAVGRTTTTATDPSTTERTGPNPDGGPCFDNVMCIRYSHWDPNACTCVPNTPCDGDTDECPDGATCDPDPYNPGKFVCSND